MDPPTTVTRVWDCSFCNITVDTTQTIIHIESPLHRLRAEGPLRVGELAETTGGDGVEEFVGSDDEDESDSEVEEDGAVEPDEIVEDEEQEEEDELSKAMYRVEGEEDPIPPVEKLLSEPRTGLLWTCDICNTTLDAIGRQHHLNSAAHFKAVRTNIRSRPNQERQPAPLDESQYPAPPTTWHCTLCAMTMAVAHQAVHDTGKRHLKLARQQRHSQSYQSRPTHRNTTGQSASSWATASYTAYPVENTDYRNEPIQPQAAHEEYSGSPAHSSRFTCTVRQLPSEPTDTVSLVTEPAQHIITAQLDSPQVIPAGMAGATSGPFDPWFCPHCWKRLHSELLGAHLPYCPGPAPKKPKKPTAHAQKRPPGTGARNRGHPKPADQKPKKGTVHVQNLPEGTPVLDSPFTALPGNMFSCELCMRTRSMVGMANHVASKLHKHKVASAAGRGSQWR